MRILMLIAIAMSVFMIGCDNTTTQIVKPVLDTAEPEVETEPVADPELPYQPQILTVDALHIEHIEGRIGIIFVGSDEFEVVYKGFEGDPDAVRTEYSSSVWTENNTYLPIKDSNGVRTFEIGDKIEVIQTDYGFNSGYPYGRVIRNITRPEVLYEYEDIE